MNNTTQHQNLVRSQLFLVRLWAEESRDVGTDNEDSTHGEIEWCGKLQHVVSGQAHYFRGCPQLTDTLLLMMQEHQEHGKGQGGSSGPQSQERLQQRAETTS